MPCILVAARSSDVMPLYTVRQETREVDARSGSSHQTYYCTSTDDTLVCEAYESCKAFHHVKV